MSQELEDKVRAYKDLSNQIAELDEKRKMLGTEILQMLSRETNTKTQKITSYLSASKPLKSPIVS